MVPDASIVIVSVTPSSIKPLQSSSNVLHISVAGIHSPFNFINQTSDIPYKGDVLLPFDSDQLKAEMRIPPSAPSQNPKAISESVPPITFCELILPIVSSINTHISAISGPPIRGTVLSPFAVEPDIPPMI